MKLRELFEHFERMYKGDASSEETARALYGETASRDAKRIPLYNRVRWMRVDDMTRAFPIFQLAQVLGWAPKTLFSDGIRDTLAYFSEHQEHYIPVAASVFGPEAESPNGWIARASLAS